MGAASLWEGERQSGDCDTSTTSEERKKSCDVLKIAVLNLTYTFALS